MGVSEGAAITGVERMRAARRVGFNTIVIRDEDWDMGEPETGAAPLPAGAVGLASLARRA